MSAFLEGGKWNPKARQGVVPAPTPFGMTFDSESLPDDGTDSVQNVTAKLNTAMKMSFGTEPADTSAEMFRHITLRPALELEDYMKSQEYRRRRWLAAVKALETRLQNLKAQEEVDLVGQSGMMPE